MSHPALQRRFGALHDTAGDRRTFHGEIVTEDASLETELAAQHIFEPYLGEPRRSRIDLGINDMCGHHCSKAEINHLPERNKVAQLDVGVAALVYRDIQM